MAYLKTGEEKKSVSLNKIVNDLFNDTVFFGVLEQDGNGKKVAKKLIQRVLEVAFDYSKTFPLVKRTSPNEYQITPQAEALYEYQITPQAEALIDTGTDWRDIFPMRGWLERLDELKNTIPNLPVELLIPAFISSRKLWAQARQFCKESRLSKQPSPEEVSANEDNIRRDLLEELSKLPGMGNNEEMVKTIETKLNDYVKELNLPLGEYSYSDHKKAIFYRLVIAFLRWLRGAELEEIQKLSVMKDDETDTQHFQSRYVEKASWLSVMCSRFFAESYLLQPYFIRELPQFSSRLRYGITSEGLPFSENIFAKWGFLTRVQIQELVNNQITAATLIKNRFPIEKIAETLIKNRFPIEKIAENERLSQEQELHKKAKTIVGRVFSFYEKQLYELKGEMSNGEGWDKFDGIFRSFVGKKERRKDHEGGGIRDTKPEDVENLKQCIIQLLKVDNKVQVVSSLGNEIRIKVGNNNLLFVILAPNASLNTGTEPGDLSPIIIIRLPWRNEESPPIPSPCIELTACGGMVLAELLDRGFFTPTQFINRMKKRTTRILSIKDIIQECREDMPDLRRSGNLQEALLKFNEPGI